MENFDGPQKRQMQQTGARRPRAPHSHPAPPPAQASERTVLPQFLREVRAELRKVAWPSRTEVRSYSILVLDHRGGLHRVRGTILDVTCSAPAALWLFDR